MGVSNEQFTNGAEGDTDITTRAVISDADAGVMPKIVPTSQALRDSESVKPEPSQHGGGHGGGQPFIGELFGVIFYTLFVALSFVSMLSATLVLMLPIDSMRIFNTLGMSERAVDFAERYILRELGRWNVSQSDALGNMTELSKISELDNDEFVEALNVTITLSNKLMTTYYHAGNAARGAYYAERLEKYTRVFLSLNGFGVRARELDYGNITSMPILSMRPVVYSFAHTLRVLNYSARAYLGKTNVIAYNHRTDSIGVMTELSQGATNLEATSDNIDGKTQLLDNFIDYIDSLCAYIDVELWRAGVIVDVSTRVDAHSDGVVIPNIPIVSESAVKSLYFGKMKGDEFALFLTPRSDLSDINKGYARIFNQLETYFPRYAQWAAEITPRSDGDIMSGQLHRLYWLRVLTEAWQKLWYMEMLMNYSFQNYGLNGTDIQTRYSVCKSFANVEYDGRQDSLPDLYNRELEKYISQFQS